MIRFFAIALAVVFLVAIPSGWAFVPGPTGVIPTITLTEPTTYVGGALLTDLKETHIIWKIDAGPESVVITPATKPAGGGTITNAAIVVPIAPCQKGTINIAGTAVSTSGGESARFTAPPLPVDRTHETPCIPTVVTALAATPGSNQVMLTWAASTDDKAVTGYRVERCTGTCAAFTPVGTPTGTAYTDTGLTASTFYGYRVVALDADANVSVPSTVVNVTTLAGGVTSPPTGITAQ